MIGLVSQKYRVIGIVRQVKQVFEGHIILSGVNIQLSQKAITL